MISVILLLEDCYSDQAKFIKAIDGIFSEFEEDCELLAIANGTGHYLQKRVREITGLKNPFRAFEFANQVSQAVCLKAILKETSGDIIAVFGSYQQLKDEAIRDVVASLDQSCDVVSPWRKERVDPRFNRLQSHIFNWIMRRIIGAKVHDFSCTLKVARKAVLEETELYGNMFRFLPVLAAARGFRIKEVAVEHLQERGKTGFYSMSEYVTRLIDIFTLFFNTRFTRKPLRFFSFIGLCFSGAGLLSFFILFVQRLFYGVPIGNRSFLFISLLLIILGVLIASAGLLGEIITFTNGRRKKEYTIEKVI
jgi:hypothetical protein